MRVPDNRLADLPPLTGATVYCSASNEVKRRFPIPSFRPSDVSSGTPVDLTVTLAPDAITVETGGEDRGQMTEDRGLRTEVTCRVSLEGAQHPERTAAAVEKAFARMGGTD